MYEKKVRFKSRMEEMIDDIKPYIFRKKINLNSWKFSDISSDFPPASGWTNIEKGFSWSPKKFPVWFEGKFQLEEISEEESAYLELWFGGESLVLIDGNLFGEINPFHKTIDISKFCDGKKHIVNVQSVPKSLFGHQNRNPLFEKAQVLIKDRDIDRITRSLTMAVELFKISDNEDFYPRLARLIEDSISAVKLPKDTDSYSKIVYDHERIWNHVYRKWESEEVPITSEHLLNSKYRDSILEAEKILNSGLEKLRKRFPNNGEISLCGHAHIDYAWLWPVKETKRKLSRTFANAIRMAEKYPDFVFTQSSAQMYQDLKEKYPSLYSRLKELVSEGKWEITGGMWVESDCNVPSAESMIRQFTFAQKFFMKEFGIKSSVCWLPDVFGFSWIMPQICKDSGIDYFLTTKLNWNEKNSLPHDTFHWRGIDGSEILYNSFCNRDSYNGIIKPEIINENWKNYKDKDSSDYSMMSFGYGDGGGGPADEMMDNYEIIKDYPTMPSLKMRHAREHFEILEDNFNSKIPVWDDELYFEFHRGTLTSQARTKKLHKDAEDAIYDLEMISTVLSDSQKYPQEDIVKSWHKILINEFHDILPGSSIKEVYEDSESELSQVVNYCRKTVSEKLEKSCTNDPANVSVVNTGNYNKNIEFEMDGMPYEITDGKGNKMLSQKTADGNYIYLSEEKIEPFSVMKLRKEKIKNIQIPDEDHTLIMENAYLKVDVKEDGSICIFSKTENRDIFKSPSNKLFVYDDVPTNWDAWDIDHNHEKYGTCIKADKIEVIESGSVRKIIRVTYDYEASTIIQDYILGKHYKKLDIKTKIDWHHRRKLIKAKFDINALSRKATFDIGAGYIERPTTRNTSWEEAKFEVPAHRWADYSQSDFGVSILNDGKYGYGCEYSIMTLSLLKSAVNPSLFADEGEHEFSYAVYPHSNFDSTEINTQAEILNRKLLVSDGNLGIPEKFISIDSENVKVLSLNRTESNGIILRMVETSGSDSKVNVKLDINSGFNKVWLTNLLEDKKEELSYDDNGCRVCFKPFKIITLMFE